jgi:hypothetical protein
MLPISTIKETTLEASLIMLDRSCFASNVILIESTLPVVVEKEAGTHETKHKKGEKKF